ncbi:UCP5-like protein [Mya arenaria]|uniref:UCP5-like protein n=1 Tax=Mya arenaria TaxID=6604 RepID=A0ABY7G123_MYAAR|nr:UCP5-like protein [Mya arenaria]
MGQRKISWEPFVYGGLASVTAECGTFPIDTTKTRLQIQGQRIDAKLSQVKYNGMIHALLRIFKEEVNVFCGIVAGIVSSSFANPTDVRMQARSSLSGKETMVRAFHDIFRQEGVRGLWRGVGPTAQRAAIVVGVELPAYDMIKKYIINHHIMGDTKETHFVSSFTAGLAGAIASTPVDVVKS